MKREKYEDIQRGVIVTWLDDAVAMRTATKSSDSIIVVPAGSTGLTLGKEIGSISVVRILLKDGTIVLSMIHHVEKLS